MNLFDEYRFYATYDGNTVQVYPTMSGLVFGWEKPNNGVILRKKLVSDLVFTGSDFQYFYDIYQNADCLETTISIEKYCNGSWAEAFAGVIAINEGDYNLDRCEVTYNIKPDDKQQCFDNNINAKYNWLAFGTTATVKTLYGTIETTVCTYSGVVIGSPAIASFYKSCWSGTPNDTTHDNAADPTTAWRPIEHHQVFTPGSPANLSLETTWARERAVSASTPPGDGWVSLGGTDWARPVTYASYIQTTTGTTNIDFEAVIADVEADNGLNMNSAIEDCVSTMGCSLTVVSNFFGINPDLTNPSNSAYDYAAARLQSMVMFQKSDVVNEDATNNATVLQMSFLEFINDLKAALNIDYGIDGDTLYIEHASYFAGVNGDDYTSLEDGKYIAGKNRFKAVSGVPSFESFEWQESFNEEFRYGQISYPSQCTTDPELNRKCNLACGDFGGLLNNAEAGLLGFVLVAAYDLGSNEYLISTYNDVLNGALTWESLFEDVWAYERFLYNASPVTVQSVQKRKEQTQFSIPFCCFDTFDPKLLYNTDLGWGKVKSAEEDTRTHTLKIILLQE